jgi:hypothetical protein
MANLVKSLLMCSFLDAKEINFICAKSVKSDLSARDFCHKGAKAQRKGVTPRRKDAVLRALKK